MHVRRPFLLALLALVPLSCSDDEDGGADGPMEALVARTPADALEGEYARIVLMDLDAATELSGVARPGEDSTDDERTDWIRALTGIEDDSDVAVRFPQPTERYPGYELRDRFGWELENVKRFVEVQAVPDVFTMLDTTDVSAADLEDAFGAADRDDIWTSGEGDGEVFVALDDATLVMSPTSRLIDDWRDEDDLLDRNDAVTSMAKALDDNDVYGAIIVPEPPRLTDPDTDGIERLPGFSSLAFGLAVDDGTPTVVIVYHYESDEDAQDAVEQTRVVLTEESDGGSNVPGLVSNVNVDADGSNVVAVGALSEPPRAIWNLFNAFDIAFAAS